LKESKQEKHKRRRATNVMRKEEGRKERKEE
jgi:hypothetical protein